MAGINAHTRLQRVPCACHPSCRAGAPGKLREQEAEHLYISDVLAYAPPVMSPSSTSHPRVGAQVQVQEQVQVQVQVQVQCLLPCRSMKNRLQVNASQCYRLWPSCSAYVRACCSALGPPYLALPFGGRAVTEVLQDLRCGLALTPVRHDLPSQEN